MFGVATINSAAYQPLANITELSKIEYCNRHGYSFYSLVGYKYSPNMGFNKIHYMLEILQQTPSLDWLLWCDCDAMITNLSIRIEDKIDNNFHFITPVDVNDINVGNLLVRNTEEGRNYLRMIIDKEPIYIKHIMAEQQVIIDSHKDYTTVVKVVPQKHMNSYEPQLYLPQNIDTRMDILGTSGVWEQGDWIVHWPGLPLSTRINQALALSKLIIR